MKNRGLVLDWGSCWWGFGLIWRDTIVLPIMSDDFEFKRRRKNALDAAEARRERDRLKKQRKRATVEGAEENRVRAAAGMAKLRAVGREVEIPAVEDPVRKAACELDLVLYYRTYYPQYTYLEPAEYQIRILKKLQRCILYGTSKAIAAPRGGAKDTLFMIAINWAISYGHRRWLAYIAANMDNAVAKLEVIKIEWETNDLLLADFPEIAAPIRALERSPQRARGQRILDPTEMDEEGNPGAYFSYIVWGAEGVTFPTVKGSKASGARITPAGLDGAIRGMSAGHYRPDFACINDGETEKSAKSEVECKNRTNVIEKDVSGLAGPGKSLPKFMLCTIIRKGCVADVFTDRTKKPAWDGERIQAMEVFPEREDMWEEYMRLRREGQMGEDPDGRMAHRYYLENREVMDRGAVVAWVARYIRDLLEDGEPAEVSAIQHIYNQRCDNGEVFFFSEMQNDPLPENQDTIGLNAKLVASRCGGYSEGIVPASVVRLTRGLDVGARQVHSVVVGWLSNGDSFVVNYTVYQVEAPVGDLRNPSGAVRQALEMAVLSTLRMAQAEVETHGFVDTEGETRFVDLTLVDSGFLEKLVYKFCAEAGPKYRPVKGYGTRQGQRRYASPQQKSKARRPMYHCYASKMPTGQILYHVNADYWKLFAQLRFLQDPDTPGARSLWGLDPAKHRQYANHICAEQWDPTAGKWIEESPHNHFLDATGYADCGAGMLGIRIESLASRATVDDGAEAPSVPERRVVKVPGKRPVVSAPSRRNGGARVVKVPRGAW